MEDKDFKKLVNELKDVILPIGSIMCFASKEVPSNYLPCDGREVMISQYPKLYELIGKTFGEPESEFGFLIPDLRGRFVRGWDDSSEIDPERDFGSSQDDSIQGHSHSISYSSTTDNSGGHTHKVYYTSYKVGSNVFENDRTVYEVSGVYNSDHSYGGDPGTNYSGSHSHTLPKISVGKAIDDISGKVRVDTETRPKNLALLFCIKAL